MTAKINNFVRLRERLEVLASLQEQPGGDDRPIEVIMKSMINKRIAIASEAEVADYVDDALHDRWNAFIKSGKSKYAQTS